MNISKNKIITNTGELSSIIVVDSCLVKSKYVFLAVSMFSQSHVNGFVVEN